MTGSGPCAPPRPDALRGHRVIFTGRLAGCGRGEAMRLVEAAGGRSVSAMSPRVTLVVVGVRGWPLLESGRVPRVLAEAEALRDRGADLKIISELEFREMIGLDPAPAGDSKTLDATQVAKALGVDARALDRWAQFGLVRPLEGRYDFRDLVSLKTVTELVARGVSPAVIRQSLEGLVGVLPGVDRPLAQLRVLVSDTGELVAELEDALLGPGGQLHLNFERKPAAASEPGAASLRAEIERGSADWAAEGLARERAGDTAGAERAYRRAISEEPSNGVLQMNLGNVLLARGRLHAAAERLAQAVALDPSLSRAWYNLAYVEDELGRRKSALRSLRRAIGADGAFADAYFNLADLSERLGLHDQAQRAWREYLKLEPNGESAAEARRRLRRPTWP